MAEGEIAVRDLPDEIATGIPTSAKAEEGMGRATA